MKIITPAVAEPVTLALARKQCRVDPTGSPPAHVDDDLIQLYISTAREWAESELGRTVAPSLVESTYDEFPADTTMKNSAGTAVTRAGTLTLESGPVLSVTSITYLDPDNIEQTVDPTLYTLDTTKEIAVVRLVSGESWPDTSSEPNAVTVQYMVGYSFDADSPQDQPMPRRIKVAILLVTAHLYARREESTAVALTQIPMGACELLSPLILRRRFA